MTARYTDTVWKSPDLATRYLEGVRAAMPLAAEQFDTMLRLLATVGRPIRRFVDLGCGAGGLSAPILDRWPSAAGVLIDFSPTMLAVAERRLAPHADRVTFRELDYGDTSWVRDLPHAGNVDAVVSGYSIHHQSDAKKRRIYRQIHDLLAPGGVFVNVEHVASATPRGQAMFKDMMVDALFDYHRADDPTVTRKQVRRHFIDREDTEANQLAMVEDQCRWLRRIGFEDVDCYFKLFELAVFGGRRGELHDGEH